MNIKFELQANQFEANALKSVRYKSPAQAAEILAAEKTRILKIDDSDFWEIQKLVAFNVLQMKTY